MIIYQGDQYAIPFSIKLNGTDVTPELVEDVRIQVADQLLSSASGGITFNSETGVWDFPVDEEMTRALSTGAVQYQVGLKIDGVIRYSPTLSLNVGKSIIRAGWSNV